MPTNIPTSKPPSDHAHQAPPGHPALALLRKKIDVDLLPQWLGHHADIESKFFSAELQQWMQKCTQAGVPMKYHLAAPDANLAKWLL